MANCTLDQMSIAVVSHKLCWGTPHSAKAFVTDGGFPLQMRAISELFGETRILVPCSMEKNAGGVTNLTGRNLNVVPLSVMKGKGLRRKLGILGWVVKNGLVIWLEIKKADAVHTPIPGDIGTIGMLFALLQRKPLFVRHCGNWFVQRTIAERFWKWSIEFFAGGQNVMFATGGAPEPPSRKNRNIKWIFSTSLGEDQIQNVKPRKLPGDGTIRLITVCRQEKRKGTGIVIEALPHILKKFPKASLEIVGDGTLMPKLKRDVEKLGLQSRIRFHGKVSQANVIGLLKNADLFCYPTSASEGFPKVVLEALAAGLPVITTKVSVLPRLIENGGGVLLDKPSAQALAEAVEGICSDKDRYEKMSARAIDTAKTYSLEAWRDFIGRTLCKSWKIESLPTSVKLDRKLQA